MDKAILLLIAAAIGVALLLLLSHGPSSSDNQPAPAHLGPLVEEADAAETSGLSPIPDKLLQAARVIASHPSVEYPEAGVSSLLDEPSSELGRAAAKVLPRPQIAYPDSGILAVLEEPPPGIPPATLPRPCISYPDSAAVFVLELLSQDLITSMARVKPYISVTYADAAWSGSLSPPSGLLKEGE